MWPGFHSRLMQFVYFAMAGWLELQASQRRITYCCGVGAGKCGINYMTMAFLNWLAPSIKARQLYYHIVEDVVRDAIDKRMPFDAVGGGGHCWEDW
jgi:hypothetical protein